MFLVFHSNFLMIDIRLTASDSFLPVSDEDFDSQPGRERSGIGLVWSAGGWPSRRTSSPAWSPHRRSFVRRTPLRLLLARIPRQCNRWYTATTASFSWHVAFQCPFLPHLKQALFSILSCSFLLALNLVRSLRSLEWPSQDADPSEWPNSLRRPGIGRTGCKPAFNLECCV